MNPEIATPLEDELGDVLEKAMRRRGFGEDLLGEKAKVDPGRIREAIDYRSQLDCEELRRLAAALDLNEVGLCALASGRYPLPEIQGLPFCVWPLHMPHGIGVVNAYVVAECAEAPGILFDTGAGIAALGSVWPPPVRKLQAVFLTHVETEHAGGLCEVVEQFSVSAAFVPKGVKAPCGHDVDEGEVKMLGSLEITTYSAPGHAKAHNCYLVRSREARGGRPLLISGDLVFAGSAGGGYFSHRELEAQLRRVLGAVPPSTVIAPGHGPMTTVENELRYNPFLV